MEIYIVLEKRLILAKKKEEMGAIHGPAKLLECCRQIQAEKVQESAGTWKWQFSPARYIYTKSFTKFQCHVRP